MRVAWAPPDAVLPSAPVRKVVGVDRLCYAQCLAGSPMTILGILLLESQPDQKHLVALLEEIVDRHWKLRCVIRNGRWYPCKFELDKHLVYVPSPLTEPVENYISREANRAFNMAECLWQLQVFRASHPGEHESLCLFRFHHCLGDGLSLVHLLQNFFHAPLEQALVAKSAALDADPGASDLRLMASPQSGPHVPGAPKGEVTRTPVFMERSTPRCLCLWRMTWVLWGPWVMLCTLLMWADRDQGMRRSSSSQGKRGHCCRRCCCIRRRPIPEQKRCVWSKTYPLEDIRRIGSAVGTKSVTSVVLSLVSGALRDYLSSCGVQKPSDVKAIVPFSLRGKHEMELKNQVATLFFNLPVGTDSDVSRLRTCVSRMDRMKVGPYALVSVLLLKIGLLLLPMKWLIRFQEHYAAKCTLVASSIPGPPRRIFFAGCPLSAVYGFVPPVGDLPMCLAIFAHDGRLSFGLLVDEGMEEPQRLFDYYANRLENLKAALGVSDLQVAT